MVGTFWRWNRPGSSEWQLVLWLQISSLRCYMFQLSPLVKSCRSVDVCTLLQFHFSKTELYIKQSHVGLEHFWFAGNLLTEPTWSCLWFSQSTRREVIKAGLMRICFIRVPTEKAVGTSPSSLLLFTLQQIRKYLCPLSLIEEINHSVTHA